MKRFMKMELLLSKTRTSLGDLSSYTVSRPVHDHICYVNILAICTGMAELKAGIIYTVRPPFLGSKKAFGESVPNQRITCYKKVEKTKKSGNRY